MPGLSCDVNPLDGRLVANPGPACLSFRNLEVGEPTCSATLNESTHLQDWDS